MGRMIRKQLYIDASQEALLKARAAAQGVSEADLVRQALDALLGGTGRPAVAEARWSRLMTMAEERRATTPSSARTWNREELHERKAARGW